MTAAKATTIPTTASSSVRVNSISPLPLATMCLSNFRISLGFLSSDVSACWRLKITEAPSSMLRTGGKIFGYDQPGHGKNQGLVTPCSADVLEPCVVPAKAGTQRGTSLCGVRRNKSIPAPTPSGGLRRNNEGDQTGRCPHCFTRITSGSARTGTEA